MSRARAFVGSVFVYTVSNAAAAAIPLFLLPILTRVLSAEDYGRVGMFSMVVSSMAALTGLSVYGAVSIRYFDRGEIDFPRYVASCLAILAASSGAVFLAVLIAATPLSELTQLPTAWLLAAVLVAMAQFVLQIQFGIWQSAAQPLHFGALRISQAAIDAGVSLLLVLVLGLAWQGRAAGIAIAALAVGLVASVMLYRDRWVAWPPRMAYVRSALKFGVPLVPHVLGGLLLTTADRVLITNLLGVDSTGIYMVSVQIGLAFGLVMESVNRAYAPWLIEAMRREDTKRDVAIVRMTYLYFVALLLGTIILHLLAPVVLRVLVGRDFFPAGEIVGVTALGFAFGGMYLMVTNYVFYAGKTAQLAVATVVSGVFNVGASYLLIQANGVIGAAQAFAAAQALLFVLTWILAQRSRPMPWLRAMIPA